MDAIAVAAEIIVDRRLRRAALDVLPAGISPRDEADAYRIQDAVHERLAATPVGRRIGYKIGCTTPVMQAYLGIPNPCGAGLFAGVVHRSGATLPHSGFRRVGIECEIAVRLGRDLEAGATTFTAASVGSAVAAYMPAIEIVDDRYADWRTIGTPTLIADDFFAAGAVLGQEVAPQDAGDIAAASGTTLVNGVEIGRGHGRDVLGHPLNALAWLANNLGARGKKLRAGEIVLCGSLVQTQWLNPGDRTQIAIAGLGEVAVTFE